MAKIYIEDNIDKNEQGLEPNEETIRFLLSYSKALSIINYNTLNIKALLN